MAQSREPGCCIGCIALAVISMTAIWFVNNVLPFLYHVVLPCLLAGAALYGAGIALWNYSRAFASNVKPGRPAP